jgi:choline dehydrogenase-like flavoprotein
VLLVEEGEHFGRKDFSGRPLDMMRKLYRASGATLALGNTAIPVPTGKGVGGTTLINSGTCFRVPEETLRGWRERSGVADLTPEALAPWYAEVERFLEVAPSTPKAIGPTGDVIARGCDALGYSHHPLARNAPGCDGQGLCCFGCPTGAKRSTDVSYVPAALERGAQLVTGLRIERVLLEGDRAVGVQGAADGPWGARSITVRAKAVVLSMGALGTPALLLRQRLANRSDQVGRNLSIHPATAALAVFDEEIRPFDTVPQGYAIDEFRDEGLLFEGSSLPLQLTAAMTPGFGPSYVALMEEAQRTAVFGFLVKDSSRGRVTVGPTGEVALRYWLNDRDLGQVRRGLGILARVYLAAGARRVLLPVAGWDIVSSLSDVTRFESARFAARHVDLTAYHPLGTCQLGADPRRSVVGPTHETHDVRSLFVCDGSALPGSPGVNPQLTIMALSLRAAGFVEQRLS